MLRKSTLKPVLLPENLAGIRSRQVIRIGFALVMLIIFFIVLFSLWRLSVVHDTLAKIVAHEQVVMEMLTRIQQSARERSLLLYSIASTKDPFERDELILKYVRMSGQVIDARNKLLELKLDQVEENIVKELDEYLIARGKLQSQVLELLSMDRFQAVQVLLNEEALPAQNKMFDSFNKVFEYETKKTRGSVELLNKEQRQTQFLMVISGLVAALFAGWIANFINRRMGKLLSGLESSAYQIQEANQSLESLRLAMDQHDIVSIADVHGNITFVNDKFCQISEYSREELLGKNYRIVNSGTHPASFFTDMWSTISSGGVWQGEVCNRNKSGGNYWIASTIVPFLDAAGLPYQYISVRTEITSIKEAEQVLMRGKYELENLVHERTVDLKEREEMLSSLATAAQDAVIMINSDGNVTHWNPAAEKMFGYSAAEIIGSNLHGIVVPIRYLDAYHAEFSKFIQTGAGEFVGAVTETDAKNRDGSEFPIEVSISGVKIKNSWHAVAIVRDITIRKLADKHLKQLASTDALTGAYNRRHFNDVMDIEIARAKRYGSPLTLIIFDIDHFKRVNDNFGHPAGDQVLIKLALLVSANIRDTDIFARWGGEEFVILAANCDSRYSQNLAEKIRKLVEAYSFAEVGKVTCSFGVAEYRAGDDQQSLTKRADINLYSAKASGRNRVCGEE